MNFDKNIDFGKIVKIPLFSQSQCSYQNSQFNDINLFEYFNDVTQNIYSMILIQCYYYFI